MNTSVMEETVFKEYLSLRYSIARIALKGQSQRGVKARQGFEMKKTRKKCVCKRRRKQDKTPCLY